MIFGQRNTRWYLLIGYYLLLVLAITGFGCQSEKKDFSIPLYPELDVQGHRGCKGLLPENTVDAFIHALELGVTTLEMDVVISKDSQVVLSHEPYIDHRICLDNQGNELDSAAQFEYNIYQMTYEEITSYDCGTKALKGFPHRKQTRAVKPLLSQVIERIEDRTKELGRSNVRYNIELKSMPGYDNIFHPGPSRFTSLVLGVVQQYGIEDRTVIQSFDPRILQEVRQQQPKMPTAMLVTNSTGPLQDFIQLGFKPDIYSPNYDMVTDSMVFDLHRMNIAVITWTVNDTADMRRMIQSGVDGIITDYPNVLLKLVDN